MRIRTNKKKDFTIISNSTAQDTDLSLEELGFLTRCLSMPDVWEFNTAFIWKNWRIGRDRIREIFNSLIQKSRCIRVVEKNNKNKNLNNGFSYEIFDEPFMCKQKVKELENEGFIVEHSGNFGKFKKCLQEPDFQGPGAEGPETQGLYKETVSTVSNSISTIKEEGNVLDSDKTLPATQGVNEGNGNGNGKSKFPLKKEQVPIFNLLKTFNLDCDDDTLKYFVRVYSGDKIQDCLNHLKIEIDKGSPIKSRAAFLRNCLSGKMSTITKEVSHNKKHAENIKEKMKWSDLEIHEKYCICQVTQKEVPFNIPNAEFCKQMEALWKLKLNYN